MMQVEILLHGVLAGLAARERMTLTLPEGADVNSAFRQIAGDCPQLAERLTCSACAIGDELVSRRHPLEAGAVLAMIPPVSGG